MKLINVCLIAFIWVGVTECANILGIFLLPVPSHQNFFGRIWKELALRGHNVTVMVAKPLNDSNIKNLREIDFSFSFEFMEKLNVVDETQGNTDVMLFWKKIVLGMLQIMDEELSHPEVQALINDKNTHFDVILSEFTPPAFFYFSEIFDCPLILLSSMPPAPFLLNDIGNPIHPYIYPDVNLGYGKKLNFVQRLTSFIFDKMTNNAVRSKLYPLNEKLIKKHFGVDVSLYEIQKKRVSLVIANTVPEIINIHPVLPNIIEIHGIHLKDPSPLPQDLKEFLDDASEGAIYFSLGTYIVSNDLKEKFKMFEKAFSELPYKVVWKLDADIKINAKKIYVRPFFESQQDILRHPNVKCFITQGGLHSVEEAMAYYVPMIGMPFLGDQFGNVKGMVQSGMGLELDFNTATKEEIKSTILEIMNNKSYSERIKQVGSYAFDQPMKPMDEIIWWIDYVIRHKGAYHFRSPYFDLNWIELYHLDVFCIMIGIIAIILLLIYIILKTIINFFKPKRNTKRKTE